MQKQLQRAFSCKNAGDHFLYLRWLYFRLQELKGYHDQGLGYGKLESGLTTEDFFRDFSKQSAGMNLFLSDTRYLLKLYFNIHEASGGGGRPSWMIHSEETPFSRVPREKADLISDQYSSTHNV